MELRELPSVDKLVRKARKRWDNRIIRPARVRLAQAILDETRKRLVQGRPLPAPLESTLEKSYEALFQERIRKVINATGVVLHTGLGRAPAGRETLQKLARELEGYCSLEIALETGERGLRTGNIEKLLSLLSGAEASVVVNNNAAALFLTLHTFSRNKQVIISRGELVQIGGGFRIPEILEASGARLVEVGTTNITRLNDYEMALKESDALLLKVHRSNFSITGHTESPSTSELARLAKKHGAIFAVDLGSGAVNATVDVSEPSVSEVVEGGAQLVCFSGDKLLGGPQAGIIVGEGSLIARLQGSPLYRALRVGKYELFLLEETLLGYLSGSENVTQKLLRLPPSRIEARAQRLCKRLQRRIKVVNLNSGKSVAGGGTLPSHELETFVIELFPRDPEKFYRKLAQGVPAVIPRRGKGKALFDLRTVFEDEEEMLFSRILESWEG